VACLCRTVVLRGVPVSASVCSPPPFSDDLSMMVVPCPGIAGMRPVHRESSGWGRRAPAGRRRPQVIVRPPPGWWTGAGVDGWSDNPRTVISAMIDAQPAAVVRCQNSSDVERGITFAREHELVLCVGGGGHDVAGNAVCDGALALDLSPTRHLCSVAWI
jgi:FAD/FMN-containing dehydrogenase